MPSILDLADDFRRRQAAQAALLFPGIDPDEILEVDVNDKMSSTVLSITLSRPVNRVQVAKVTKGHRLVATEEAVQDWTPGHAAEYRRQFDPAPTGSLAPKMTPHPDQVDQWMDKRERHVEIVEFRP